MPLATDERSRIERDLREDFGARLLNHLRRTGDDASAAETRVMLTELRSLLDTLDPRRFLLGECVNEWHTALSELCAEHRIELRWNTPVRWPALALSPIQRCNPLLILREFIRNAALHSQPAAIDIRLRRQGDVVAIQARHDGLKAPPQHWQAARGLRMTVLRTQDLRGELEWSMPSASQLQLDLRFAVA